MVETTGYRPTNGSRGPTATPPTGPRPVDRLSAAGVAGARDDAVTGKRVSGPLQGLRPALAEDVHRPPRRRRDLPDRPHRALEGALPDVLAEGPAVLCAAVRDRPGRGRPARDRAAARRAREAVDRRPRPLRGRRVVHVHDPRRPYPVGMDHLLRPARRRRDDRPGAGPRAAVRPVRRAGLHARRQPQNNRFWEATLRNLATAVGVAAPVVETQAVCIDKNRQWRYWRNVRNSATIRSARRTLTAPFRKLTGRG